jgi:hypothetical protein
MHVMRSVRGPWLNEQQHRDATASIHAAFYKFVVSGDGIDMESNSRYTVRIDPHFDCVTEDVAREIVSWADVDSVLGKADCVPLSITCSLYPLGCFKFVMKKSVHLKHKVLINSKVRSHTYMHT